ncbi:hypothetical protein BGZ82_010028 [Podila clonocystis]|nr:hypothetical protein BGZ82_010028 [Podila clonocystis]
MSYRGGHGRGGGGVGMQKPRGGGQAGMNFQGDMHQQQQPQPPQQQQQQQQQFGFQQRGFPPQMMQQQQQNMPPQPIQIPPLQPGSRSFMGGMPSPSLVQGSSMPMVGGYQGGSSKERMPFGPPVGPVDNGPKTHHDILRRHNEEYQMKQQGQLALSQAMSATLGSYMAVPGRHNNSIVPVLPRLNNPTKE